jgi:two-component system, NarL family, response regulator NreC
LINIILADDHNLIRQGVRSLLEKQPDLRVIAEAADGVNAARLAESLKPDILIVDLMMDGLNGIEVTRRVTKNLPETRVVVLTVYNNEKVVLESLRAGAKAYVLKESCSDDLIHAIHEAASGHFYLGPPLSERAVKAYMERTPEICSDPQDSLTIREREVLNLLAQGWTNVKIATQLYISRRTVEIHRANIARKLSIHTQGELIRYAIRNGVLTQDNNADILTAAPQPDATRCPSEN